MPTKYTSKLYGQMYGIIISMTNEYIKIYTKNYKYAQ